MNANEHWDALLAEGAALRALAKARGRRGANNRLPSDVKKTDSRGRTYYGPPDKPHHQTGGISLSPRHNLGAITNHDGDDFHHVREHLERANDQIVTTAIKGARDHEHLGRMHAALGDRAFGLALDHMHGGHLSKILRTVDRHHGLSETDEHGMRAHLKDLATGAKTPTEGSGKPKRRRAAAPEPEGRRGLRSSMTARPGGGELPEFSRSAGARARRDDDEVEGRPLSSSVTARAGDED